jgi:Cys-tRNA(Pro) deacylase
MSSSVTERIQALLHSRGIEFAFKEHAPVKTSQEAADVRGTPLHEGAKALVFSADETLVLAVVPAHKRVSSRAFKRAYGVKNLRMITPDELREHTGLPVGAVPPFGSVLDLPTYVDRGLLENERISFNAGSRTASIVMACRDYVAAEEPTLGDFAGD